MIPEHVYPVLSEVFGHDSLRPSQQTALAPVLEGRDAVIVMPTGTGKSLCFQLPAMLDEGGLTIVVSPLISLMKDQVDALTALGICAGTLNSSLSGDESRQTYDALFDGRLRLLYVAPERLSHGGFLDAVTQRGVARVAVDEAHCVSQWGHDFRPDYLRIETFLERIGRPQIVALTATATPFVRDDIVRSLGMRDPAVVVTGFDRPGLACHVHRVRSAVERDRLLVEAIAERKGAAGASIVYVGSRKNADRAADALRSRGHDCDIYHAGLSADERTRVQDAFMSGVTSTVVATNAFGMGIDRTDVRLVLHYDIPGSLEAYYQEIGRAGRDGEAADAVLLFSEASVRLQEFFVARAHPTPAVVCLIHSFLCDAADDGLIVEVDGLEEQVGDREIAPQVPAAVNKLIAIGLAGRAPTGGVFANLHVAGELEERLDAEGMAARREADEAKLSAVVRYARQRVCRRNVILEYFQAESDGATCGRCDVCTGAGPAGVDLDDDAATVLRKILSGVARTKGYAGKKKIVGMLTGSKAQDVGGTWLAELSTYGIIKHMSRDRVDACVVAAMDGGLIDTDGDKYPVLKLSAAGVDVLKGAPPPQLAWPAAASRAVAPSKSSGAAELPDWEGADAELAERLRSWRSEQAATAGVPAYVVFGNKTLADLVASRPTDLRSLEDVYGLGPSKIEKYGAQLLEVFEAAS